MFEKIERSNLPLLRLPGKVMVADLLIKGLGVQLHSRVVVFLRMRRSDLKISVDDILKSLKAKKRQGFMSLNTTEFCRTSPAKLS